MKTTMHSKVMTISNKLVKEGYNRANATLKAWVLVKMPLVETKVSGVTFGKRQKAIEHLSRYFPEQISVHLVRDSKNSYDKNSVAVYAEVRGKGSYCMGYLPKALAAFIAPLMDAGKDIHSAYKEIRGMYQPYMNFGLAITLEV